MLHDIKSRFFGNGWGYVVTILWPGTHVAVIVGIFFFLGKLPPYGESRLLYASIGVLPYIIWNYISRFTMLGVTQNRSFLGYPIVKPLDLMIARQCLEIITCVIITLCIIIFLVSCGVDPMPLRLNEAAFALGSAMLLGIGFGILGGVITLIFPLFNVIYVLFLIIFWVTSGLTIEPEKMPTQIGYILSWNPLLHSVEWMRYAYYNDFPAQLLDRTYVLGMGGSALVLGLILERVLRLFTMK